MSFETRKKAWSCEWADENDRQGRYRRLDARARCPSRARQSLGTRRPSVRSLDDLGGVEDGHAAIQLASGDVVVEILSEG